MNLNQITIKSQDVNRAVKFYQKLGLQLIVDSSPRYVRFECPSGGSTFSISYGEVVTGVSTVIYFEVEDLELVYKKLKTRGVHFTSEPQDKQWLWREAGLNDPDGHPLILFKAGKQRRHPPWRLSRRHWYEYMCESPYNLMK